MGQFSMMQLLQHFRNLSADEQGATAVEYGLVVALIAATLITSLQLLGTNLSTVLEIISDAVTNGVTALAS
jgi:pilus assembly protein Flp/PilA